MKGAKNPFLRNAAARVFQEFESGSFDDFFFDRDSILVPAPGSAPLVEGGFWPGKRIADELVDAGLAADVQAILRRSERVPKSAFARAGERPSVQRHRETIRVEPMLGEPARIIVVDDVITKGATTLGCVLNLQEEFPDAEVRAFALLRTMGLQPEVDTWIAPCVGTIYVNRWGGAEREP